MLLPVQVRLQILRMGYLRWVERDDIIFFLLNAGSAGAKVTFRLKNSFADEEEKEPKHQRCHINSL